MCIEFKAPPLRCGLWLRFIYKSREEVRALLEQAERFHCTTAGYCNLQPAMLCIHALSSGQSRQKIHIGVAMHPWVFIYIIFIKIYITYIKENHIILMCEQATSTPLRCSTWWRRARLELVHGQTKGSRKKIPLLVVRPPLPPPPSSLMVILLVRFP